MGSKKVPPPRTWSPEDERIFPVTIVVQVTNAPKAVGFLRHTIVSPVLAAGLKYAIFRSSDKKSLLCAIFASHRRLLVEADREDYVLPLDPVQLRAADCSKNTALQRAKVVFDYTKDDPPRPRLLKFEELAIPSSRDEDPYEYMYGKFDMPTEGSDSTSKVLYAVHEEGDMDLGLAAETVDCSVLRRTDALKLLANILAGKNEGPGTGAQLRLDQYVLEKHITNWFALHDTDKVATLNTMKASAIWKVPVPQIHGYFGEKVAMYFAFLEHFTQWLIAPALVGLVAFLHQTANGSPNISWLPAVGVFVVLWSAMFIESWKRSQVTWAMRWGTTNFEETEVFRMEFCTNPQTSRKRSTVNGKPKYAFSPQIKIRRLLLSYTVIGLLIVLVVAVVFSIFLARIEFTKLEKSGDLPHGWGGYLASILNAIQIQVMSHLYNKMAVTMTDYENHATMTEYEDALITKTCLFQFVNAYFSLFYTAFLKNRITLFGLKQQCAPGANGEPDCMKELQSALAIIFISQLVVGNFTEVLMPWFLGKLGVLKAKCMCRKRESEKERHPMEVEAEQPKYDPFSDYLEQLILYGYVSLFVVAFPLAPLLGLINNIAEIRVDIFKLLHNSSRPIARGCEDIGSWLLFLDVLTYLSIASNLGVVMFTDRTFLSGYDTEVKLGVFLAVEHGVLIAKYLIAELIPDVPDHVTKHLQRQEYLVNKHILNLPDDVEDFGGSEDIASQPSDDASKHLQLHFHDLVVQPRSVQGDSGVSKTAASYGSDTDELKSPDPELSRPLLRAEPL